MLWYYRFTWHPHTRVEDVRRRVLEQQETRVATCPARSRLVQPRRRGAGLVMLESDNPREVSEILQTYMDLMSWDVHGLHELSYNQALDEFRKQMQAVA